MGFERVVLRAGVRASNCIPGHRRKKGKVSVQKQCRQLPAVAAAFYAGADAWSYAAVFAGIVASRRYPIGSISSQERSERVIIYIAGDYRKAVPACQANVGIVVPKSSAGRTVASRALKNLVWDCNFCCECL